jgi:hypothetical protein
VMVPSSASGSRPVLTILAIQRLLCSIRVLVIALDLKLVIDGKAILNNIGILCPFRNLM